MGELLKPIEEEYFKEKVGIRFENINEGFDKFKSLILQDEDVDKAEEKFIAFIEKAFELNGKENSYVDFYFGRLDYEAKDNLQRVLSSEDKLILERYTEEVKGNTIYFKVTKEGIPFLTRLCTREILFSTFYFTKYPCTIWGNYNMKFPMFFNGDENVEKYREIAVKCGLFLK